MSPCSDVRHGTWQSSIGGLLEGILGVSVVICCGIVRHAGVIRIT